MAGAIPNEEQLLALAKYRTKENAVASDIPSQEKPRLRVTHPTKKNHLCLANTGSRHMPLSLVNGAEPASGRLLHSVAGSLSSGRWLRRVSGIPQHDRLVGVQRSCASGVQKQYVIVWFEIALAA